MIVIGFGGEPATGKSRIMKAVMNELNEKPIVTNLKMDKHTIKLTLFIDNNVTVIGHYLPGEKFGGTDRLSMSIQPTMEIYLKNEIDKGSETTILFEGDRLFNKKFISYIKGLYHVQSFFFIVDCREHIKHERHAARDNQDESWLRGRATKVNNVRNEFDLVAVYNNIESDIPNIVDFILKARNNMLAKQAQDIMLLKEIGY